MTSRARRVQLTLGLTAVTALAPDSVERDIDQAYRFVHALELRTELVRCRMRFGIEGAYDTGPFTSGDLHCTQEVEYVDLTADDASDDDVRLRRSVVRAARTNRNRGRTVEGVNHESDVSGHSCAESATISFLRDGQARCELPPAAVEASASGCLEECAASARPSLGIEACWDPERLDETGAFAVDPQTVIAWLQPGGELPALDPTTGERIANPLQAWIAGDQIEHRVFMRRACDAEPREGIEDLLVRGRLYGRIHHRDPTQAERTQTDAITCEVEGRATWDARLGRLQTLELAGSIELRIVSETLSADPPRASATFESIAESSGPFTLRFEVLPP